MPRQERWPVGPARRQSRVSRKYLLALVIVIAFGAFNYRAILRPHSDLPTKADAVVAIAGVNNPARFAKARQLMQQGYSSVLVTDIPRDNADPSCAAPGTTCFRPNPNTTQGEARLIAAMAKAHNWHTLLLVVSRDQAFRARIRFDRCYSGELRIITVPSASSFLYNVAYQDAALIKAEVWQRGC